jgi:hypothetical protein
MEKNNFERAGVIIAEMKRCEEAVRMLNNSWHNRIRYGGNLALSVASQHWDEVILHKEEKELLLRFFLKKIATLNREFKDL